MKEHMVASFPGTEEGEEKDPCLGMRLISFPCPEQWAATFCTLQMFRSSTLARNGLHNTPCLLIWIHSLVPKVCLSLILRFCYKIGLWQSSILMPKSLFKQLWCNLICVCTSPQRHVRCLWPTVAPSSVSAQCTTEHQLYWWEVVSPTALTH